MAFSSGFLNERIIIARRAEEQAQQFGKQGQPRYVIAGWVWANAAYSKGTKTLKEGTMDAYNTIVFRMRYSKFIDEWCLINYRDRWYNITSCNSNPVANEIQITAISMANQQVTIVEQAEL